MLLVFEQRDGPEMMVRARPRARSAGEGRRVEVKVSATMPAIVDESHGRWIELSLQGGGVFFSAVFSTFGTLRTERDHARRRESCAQGRRDRTRKVGMTGSARHVRWDGSESECRGAL